MNSDRLLTLRQHKLFIPPRAFEPALIPIWPVVLICSAIAAGLTTGGWIDGLPRSVIVMWFLFVCPGMTVVGLLGIEDRITRLSLAVPLSLAIDTLGSLAGVYGGAWSPTSLLLALALFTAVGAGLQWSLMYRTVERYGSMKVMANSRWQASPLTVLPVAFQATEDSSADYPVAQAPQPKLLGQAAAPNWAFAVLAIEDADIGDGNPWSRRGPENRSVAADILISNNSDAPLAFNLGDIWLRGTDGSEYPGSEVVGTKPRLMGQNLPPGDLARGWIRFDVPADTVIAEVRFYGPRPILRVPLPRHSNIQGE